MRGNKLHIITSGAESVPAICVGALHAMLLWLVGRVVMEYPPTANYLEAVHKSAQRTQNERGGI